MTVTALHLTDEGEAADLAAFLARLIHYDRAAAVRLQVSGTALAVFGRRRRSRSSRSVRRGSPSRTRTVSTSPST